MATLAIARGTRIATRARWPMIVLRTPKRWTGPTEVAGHGLEGFRRAHQVYMADVKNNPDRIHELEQWMRSYNPEELSGAKGELLAELKTLAPTGARRMSANPHAKGGVLKSIEVQIMANSK